MIRVFFLPSLPTDLAMYTTIILMTTNSKHFLLKCIISTKLVLFTMIFELPMSSALILLLSWNWSTLAIASQKLHSCPCPCRSQNSKTLWEFCSTWNLSPPLFSTYQISVSWITTHLALKTFGGYVSWRIFSKLPNLQSWTPPSVMLSYTSLKTGKTILKLINLH